MRTAALVVLAALLLASSVPARAQAPQFTLPDKPTVAFIGNTLVERDFARGYLETRLLTAFPDKPVVFRNLGWSGDTVRGEARAGFGKPIDGFNHLAKHVADLKPNVILLNYGLNEAFAGPPGLDAFRSDLAKLLDTLAKDHPTVVLLSIMKQENLGPHLPDPAKQNENIRLYNQALATAAQQRNLTFVDLYNVPDEYTKSNNRPFTDNGIHPTPDGHRFLADAIAHRLNLPTPPWSDRDEQIRKLTIDKNQLYFHRWRPQNETYIFGFRKKEQGQNAVEIPQFDPLVAAKESEINALLKH